MAGRPKLFNDKEKWCSKCEKWLPLDAFGVNRGTPSGRQDYCRTCHATFNEAKFWDTVKRYEQLLREKYSMTPGDYLEQWRRQDKKCPICGCALALYNRDTHVHAVAEARWLLCPRCDRGMTSFEDNAGFLEKAAGLLKG